MENMWFGLYMVLYTLCWILVKKDEERRYRLDEDDYVYISLVSVLAPIILPIQIIRILYFYKK